MILLFFISALYSQIPPNREQAIRIQARLKELYSDLGGEYYSGEEAWEYLKNDTGIDLKSILERNGK